MKLASLVAALVAVFVSTNALSSNITPKSPVAIASVNSAPIAPPKAVAHKTHKHTTKAAAKSLKTPSKTPSKTPVAITVVATAK